MMKRKWKILTALILCISILIIPMQVMAAPEEKTGKTLYISEVKVGMGETSEEAAKELLAEGFTILKGDDGKYADLNEKTGTTSGMKKGPTDKIVYFGYKTTDDPKQAITDLAVMNMNGGYSVVDYEVLMANHLEGEIMPFLEHFISALKEYRENCQKPENTLNHIRADYYRQMLNKLTDDDTGKPLGDLFLNETTYEMSSEKYNALSDDEKKNHADILTILMQGNGRAVLLLETLITKSTDSADDTWLDRFVETDTEDLKAEIKKENPSLTTDADIMAELDKKYHDTAMKIYQKWDDFLENIDAYDETVNEVVNTNWDEEKNLEEKVNEIDAEHPTREDAEAIVEVAKTTSDFVSGYLKAEEAVVITYLSETEYEDGTLLDFFSRDQMEFSGDGIRSLYPMAASLSAGQVAGLDFLSITDMLAIALTNEDGYSILEIDNMEPASIYQDVDRQIYEPGGVALTNAALRAGAQLKDTSDNFELSPLGWVFWGLTGAAAVSTFGALGANIHYEEIALNFMKEAKKFSAEYCNASKGLTKLAKATTTITPEFRESVAEFNATMDEALESYRTALRDSIKYSAKSNFSYCLGIGLTVLTVILAAYSIYTTFSELYDYYKVKFTPIPRYIVDEADITQEINGRNIVINNQTAYYKVVSCNRKEGSSDTEKNNFKVLGTSNDLNGDVGKQWLTLYSVKYQYGHPILADSLKVVKGSDKLPKGYETGIHRFGEEPAFNLTSKYYCYNDDVKGTYVYFKNEKDTVAAMTMKTEETNTEKTEKTTDEKNTADNTSGSIFSAGSLALGAGIGILLGGGIVVLIFIPRLKKNKDQQTDDEKETE